jgi:hypothetical protein
MMPPHVLRLAYLGITNAFALLRLLPGGDRDKDIEILSLRHQLAVLQRQLAGQQVRFEPVDRAWLAALLHPLPRPTLRHLRLLVRPDTVLKWHRDLIARRHAAASRPRRRGRPRTLRSIQPRGLTVDARLATDQQAHHFQVLPHATGGAGALASPAPQAPAAAKGVAPATVLPPIGTALVRKAHWPIIVVP